MFWIIWAMTFDFRTKDSRHIQKRIPYMKCRAFIITEYHSDSCLLCDCDIYDYIPLFIGKSLNLWAFWFSELISSFLSFLFPLSIWHLWFIYRSKYLPPHTWECFISSFRYSIHQDMDNRDSFTLYFTIQDSLFLNSIFGFTPLLATSNNLSLFVYIRILLKISSEANRLF